MTQFFFRAIFLFVVTIGLSCPCEAQMMGVPSPTPADSQWDQITSMLPDEEPTICMVWNKSGNPNAGGNPSDQWFANADIQESLGKLKSAIAGLENQIGSPAAARIVADIGWKLLQQPGYFAIEINHLKEDFDPSQVRVGVVSRLGEYEKEVATWVDELGGEMEMEKSVEGGANVWVDKENEVRLGVRGGCLLFAVNETMWSELNAKLDGSKAPAWLTEKTDMAPMERRSLLITTQMDQLLAKLPLDEIDPDAKRVLAELRLDQMKSISMASGADGFSNLSVTRLEMGFEGMMSALDVKPYDESDFFPIPADSSAAIAVRFRPDNIAALVKRIAPEPFEDARRSMIEEFGIDFESDLANSLDGSIRYYSRGGMLTPRIVGVVGVKDRVGFDETLGKINDAIAARAFGFGGEFYEKESKSGVKVFGMDGGMMFSIFWAYHEGELYLSNNKRAIPSFIKKIGTHKKSASVLSTELMAKVMADAQAAGLTGPIGLQHTDMDEVVETVFPVFSMIAPMLPNDYREYFDFGLEDLPPVEAMMGLRPSANVGFRSKDGIVLLSRYDTPIATEVSTIGGAGVMIGMLLPAVQQVREAARRTVSMNNMRQLMLASLNYEATHRHMPAAYSVADDGTPLLSWRVHILPFLEQQDLYDQFHLDEPWDSPHNIKLLEKMPEVFQNPSSIAVPGKTMYVVPSGDSVAFGAGKPVGIAEMTDGMSNTLAMFECGSDNLVPWTAPQDYDISMMGMLDFDTGHPGTFVGAMCDGSTHSFSTSMSVEEFLGMCIMNDGKLFVR